MSTPTIDSLRVAHGKLTGLKVEAARLRIPHLLEAIEATQRTIQMIRTYSRLVQLLLDTTSLLHNIIRYVSELEGTREISRVALHLRSLLATVTGLERLTCRVSAATYGDGRNGLSQADGNALTSFEGDIQSFRVVFPAARPLFPQVDYLLERSEFRLANGYNIRSRFFNWM